VKAARTYEVVYKQAISKVFSYLPFVRLLIYDEDVTHFTLFSVYLLTGVTEKYDNDENENGSMSSYSAKIILTLSCQVLLLRKGESLL